MFKPGDWHFTTVLFLPGRESLFVLVVPPTRNSTVQYGSFTVVGLSFCNWLPRNLQHKLLLVSMPLFRHSGWKPFCSIVAFWWVFLKRCCTIIFTISDDATTCPTLHCNPLASPARPFWLPFSSLLTPIDVNVIAFLLPLGINKVTTTTSTTTYHENYYLLLLYHFVSYRIWTFV